VISTSPGSTPTSPPPGAAGGAFLVFFP
jgi:hypothetical protein